MQLWYKSSARLGEIEGRRLRNSLVVRGAILSVLLVCLASMVVDMRTIGVHWHAYRLRAGDMSKEGNDIISVPHHLARLIQIGPASSSELIKMLSDNAPTTIVCFGEQYYPSDSSLSDEVPRQRFATMADLANYALGQIFGIDVGFSPTDTADSRKEVIRRWKKIAEQAPGHH